MTKKRVYRWIPAERIGHWAYVALFIAALISARAAGDGGERHRSATGNPAVLHGTLGLLMIGIPLLLFLLFARKRLVENVREVTHWMPTTGPGFVRPFAEAPSCAEKCPLRAASMRGRSWPPCWPV